MITENLMMSKKFVAPTMNKPPEEKKADSIYGRSASTVSSQSAVASSSRSDSTTVNTAA